LQNVGEAFYDLSSPAFRQQGDIFPNVPLISPPPSPNLLILRNTDGTPWNPQPGPLVASSEQLLNAFDGGPEHIAASAERGLGIVLTQTCDLDQDLWLAGQLRGLDGTNIDRGNLMAGKYANLFGLPAHPLDHFGDAYVDLTRVFSVARECFPHKDRIASLTLSAQISLTEKISQSLTRPWGYAPGDAVLVSGHYRCLRCFMFDGLNNDVIALSVGQRFPECADCTKIKKRAQWRLLLKHQKY
jgi:hypothetical protein